MNNKETKKSIDSCLEETYRILDAPSEKLISLNSMIIELIDRGYLDDTPRNKSKYWTTITFRDVFITTTVSSKPSIGLKKWVPFTYKRKLINRRYRSVFTELDNAVNHQEQLDQNLFRHVLSYEEISKHFFYLAPVFISRFKSKTEIIPTTIYLYGGFDFIGWILPEKNILFDDHDKLREFIQENQLEPGDFIVYSPNTQDATGIDIYTTWQRDMDKYYREGKRDKIDYILSHETKISVRDLVYLYLIEHNFIAEDSEIIAFVQKHRPLIGKATIMGAISQFRHRIKTTKVESADSANEQSTTHESTIDPRYLLAIIQKKDLVYKYLQSNGPATADQIAGAIAEIIGVTKQKLLSLTFIDPQDSRIIRLETGEFALAPQLADKENNLLLSPPPDPITAPPFVQSRALKYTKTFLIAIITVVSIIILLIIRSKNI
ncbi:hypothetical protein KKC62_01335 [Patescibacteria group bacterium]|nr:hypothetical protein [Patescibacteria group bacterium]MBU1952841.1 hypothetical protein [Patescibacteria group bacterium]